MLGSRGLPYTPLPQCAFSFVPFFKTPAGFILQLAITSIVHKYMSGYLVLAHIFLVKMREVESGIKI